MYFVREGLRVTLYIPLKYVMCMYTLLVLFGYTGHEEECSVKYSCTHILEHRPLVPLVIWQHLVFPNIPILFLSPYRYNHYSSFLSPQSCLVTLGTRGNAVSSILARISYSTVPWCPLWSNNTYYWQKNFIKYLCILPSCLDCWDCTSYTCITIWYQHCSGN